MLISLGMRRCFGFKFLISWCWEAHHSCSVLYSSGCCNVSCNTLLETTKNGCAFLSWLWVPPSAHMYLGACGRKDMNAQAQTHLRGILDFPQPYPTCQRRLLNNLWSSACSYSSLCLAILSLTETDFNSTSDFSSCRLTSSFFVLT